MAIEDPEDSYNLEEAYTSALMEAEADIDSLGACNEFEALEDKILDEQD